jgi:spermidine synthase
VAWQREFRLIFGASTAASAAVVAIFMGSLGFGGWVLGRRVDRSRDPWRLYARLEALVAVTAALTPPLLWAARAVYLGLGGSIVLGSFAGTLLRLALATLVLLPPMFLAGGTLPAAARAVQFEADRRRRGLAVLYGVNTLGAVAGALAATFAMLEVFGTRGTLWLACALNLLVAVVARSVSFAVAEQGGEEPAAAEPATLPPALVFAAAAAVGFAFFLMELVWYRMLAPILGGTVFTFGLTLAVALAGVGLGGMAYGLLGRRRPPAAGAFAATCLAEAACLAVPFAMGDRIATLALTLRPLAARGLADYVPGWAAVTAIVVLPAALVAGFQFPLLVALLGRGRDGVGRHLGQVYAWNTAGAIAGALAGGFGLLPLLSAPACWRAASLGLAVTGLAAALAGRSRRRTTLACAAATGVIAAVVLAVPGPTAAWRHSGIGGGRSSFPPLGGVNEVKSWAHRARRVVFWEAEGVESSIALQRQSGLAFLVNGKIDGNARSDAPTQVMSGMLGALLHPRPRSALVVGLGTGSTAGWLAAVPTIQRTDVVELEPAIAEVARACAAVNLDVMRNPRVSVRYGDAREVLMTTRARYDLIVSEPSNPYRAGVASLFTREFYGAASGRLADGGMFLQWMQAYEVDDDTVYGVLATLGSVFGSVEVWQTHAGDLLLVASHRARIVDAGFAARTGATPFKEALRTWRADTPEAVMARFVAGPALAAAAVADGRTVNTDDRNQLEFGFARTVGRSGPFRLHRMRRAARRLGAHRPAMERELDWKVVDEERLTMQTAVGEPAILDVDEGQHPDRVVAHAEYLAGRRREAAEAFLRQPRPARGPVEVALMAEGLADMGDPRALSYAEALGRTSASEALAVLARLRLREQRYDESATAMEGALAAYHGDPWPAVSVMTGALAIAEDLARARPDLGPRMLAALAEPFPVYALEAERLAARMRIALMLPLEGFCRDVLAPFEGPVAWNLETLLYRRNCYEATGDPRAGRATADLEEFLRNERAP